MKMTIKPVALHVIRSVVANMTVPAVAKLNQFIIQHVATSFGKGGLIVLTGPEQPQLYTTNVVDNTEAIANMFSLSMEQRKLTQDFLRAMYVAFHDDESLCPDFLDHWKDEGVTLSDYNEAEEVKTYELLTAHSVRVDPRERLARLLGSGAGGGRLQDMFSQMFGSQEFKPEFVNASGFNDVNDAEIHYLLHNDDVSGSQMDQAQDLILAGKYKKYVKLMKKFGLPTKYIHVKKDKVKFTDFNTTTVEPATSATPVVAEGDYIALLNHKVQARNPIEEMQLMDEFYTQHGVVYEHPLCFDKTLIKLLNQRANDLITKDEMFAQLKVILDKVLGKELASKVDLLDDDGSFAMGIRANGFTGMAIKQEITMRLMNTKMLN